MSVDDSLALNDDTRDDTCARTDCADKDRSVLIGLIGSGIQLSRTPGMHEAEGRAHGLRFIYRLLDTDQMGKAPPSIADLVTYAEHFGFDGLNVTHPYKIDVVDCLDELSDAATAAGSVNTVIFKEGKRYGENTDIGGFSESFRTNLPLVPRERVLMVGAGGAGAAVAIALLENKVVHLTISDLDEARARHLSSRLNQQFGESRTVAIGPIDNKKQEFDGVVNATAIGMAQYPGTSFPVARLTPVMWAADLIYFPLETEFLRAARALGCKAISGAGMVVFQAAQAFELFTGLSSDSRRMKATFDALGQARRESNPTARSGR